MLIVCVLLLLALALLAHGALLMARADLAVSRAGAGLLRARAAADAGLVEMLTGKSPVPPDSLRRGDTQLLASATLAGARYRAGVRRLSREVWLVESEGAARPGVWVEREAWPAWSMDAAARTGAFQGVVEVGPGAGVMGQSQVRPRASVQDSRPDAADCAAWDRARDSVGWARVLPPVAVVDSAGAGDPSLGLLGVDDLLQAADRKVAGSGTPAPAVGGAGCLAAVAWNWGDPDNPLGPCHALLGVIGAAGPVQMTGGAGQGILVTSGDLILTAGARFYGVVLVGGVLTVSGGSRLVGLARAVRGLAVAEGSRVDGSACWAFEALSGARAALGRLHALPGAGPVAPLGGGPG